MKYRNRFSEQEISEIKQLLDLDVAASEIARGLDVSYHRIYAIAHGRSYKNIPPSTLSDTQILTKYFWVGESGSFKKMSEDLVRDLKNLLLCYEYPVADLSRLFDITYSRVYNIQMGLTFSHLKPSDLSIGEMIIKYPPLRNLREKILSGYI